MKKLIYFLSFALVILAFGCSQEVTKTEQATAPNLDVDYTYQNFELPEGVFQAGSFNNFAFDDFGNFIPTELDDDFLKVTDAGAKLGRVLFYDKQLSISNTVSCGTCHDQAKAFADGKQFSEGFEGKLTSRNSMAFNNPISQNNLFWDSRSFSIVDLSLKPVQNHIEMGMEDLEYLSQKINAIDYYPELFQAAYGSSIASQETIAKAIAEFIGSITTSNSRFDQGALTDLEKIGRDVFFSQKTQCSTCHGGNNFAADDSPGGDYGGGGPTGIDLKGTTNIGLELIYQDEGKEDGNFKIPSLRNVSVTGPYMHDGRFETLEQVIEHYDSGIKPHAKLDAKLRNPDGSPIRMNLTNVEKTALIAFLGSLTDEQLLTDPKYSDPFKS